MEPRRFQALQNDPNIARFVVEGTATGRQLGVGSYGSVEEVEVSGLICAGKKIHAALLDAGNVGVQEIVSKYMQECQLMSDLRHPNITQFMGVCFLPSCQLPMLLMERLDGSLDDLLETVPNIPLVLKRSLLEDVARGLLYLHKHNPQIVHRDLTAKNVLLTSSLVAKITDFGNSRIVNLPPGQLARTFSLLPGTLVYMPPEALTSASRYGPSLDVFSFGHLALFTLTQVFPGDLLEPNYANPSNHDRLVARSEVERRGEYFEQLDGSMLGEQHPCIQLTKQCLHNSPSKRPTAEQLIATLEGMRADIDGPYGAVARADAVRQVVLMKTLREREEQTREKTNELTVKEEVIQQLQLQLEQQQVELRHKDTELQHKDMELDRVEEQFHQLQAHYQDSEARYQLELRHKDTQLSKIEAQLQQLQIDTREAGDTKSLSQLSEVHLSELWPLSLNIMWSQGPNMPFSMNYYPNIAVLNQKVYVGGGGRYLSDHAMTREHTVMVYDIQRESWSLLPPYRFYWFSMAVLNDQLVLIGGVDRESSIRTNTLGALDDKASESCWMCPFPPMPTARSSTTVVVHNNRWLVVAGGYNEFDESLSGIEIFDVLARQWYSSAPLPIEAYKMSSTVIQNTWYLLGGDSHRATDRDAFCINLNNLIIEAISHPFTSSPSISTQTNWTFLPKTPYERSAALALNGALLTVGGESEGSMSVCIYSPMSNSWTKIEGMLFQERDECACTILPCGKVFIIGGCTQQVHIGTVSVVDE